MPLRIVLSALVLLLAISGIAAAGESAAKPPLRGLISMGAYRFVAAGGDPVNTLAPVEAKPGIFGGIVIVATWRQLQAAAGAPLAARTAIDDALDAVRAYNAANPSRPLGVKLRVWAGFEAPDWAMALGGPAITVNHGGKPRVLGRFWSPAYREAWAALQKLLAARYDAEPLIQEVSVTSCMSLTAEPFFLPTEPGVLTPLRAAGFTPEAFRDCLAHAVADYAPWQTSRIILAVNPFHGGPNDGGGDVAFTRSVMQACRASLGVRCVFDNHDLDTDPPSTIVPIFALMQAMGPEIEFQTYHETPPDFEGTIKKGIALGASSIELWQDFQGFPLVPADTLRTWAGLFEKQ